jgi:hypothetical protein
MLPFVAKMLPFVAIEVATMRPGIDAGARPFRARAGGTPAVLFALGPCLEDGCDLA